MIEGKNSKYLQIMYRGQKCPFIPNKDNVDSHNIKGKVVFIEKGSYNPNGWYINIVISKNEILEN